MYNKSNRRLSCILAISKNYCIGKNNSLPWHFAEDLKHFKKTTLGHSIIMGRFTYESLVNPLSDRKNYILSKSLFTRKDCVVSSSFESLLNKAYKEDDNPFIIGGSSLYVLATPFVTDFYITRIDKTIEGDVYFIPMSVGKWELVYSRQGNTPELTFEKYIRIG
jgi:dihydrofolate reductase